MILHHKLGANQNEKFTSMQTRSVLTGKSKEKKLRERKNRKSLDLLSFVGCIWMFTLKKNHVSERKCFEIRLQAKKSDMYGVAAVETPKWCWLLQVYAISILLHFIIISFEFAKLITMIFLYMYFCLLT